MNGGDLIDAIGGNLRRTKSKLGCSENVVFWESLAYDTGVSRKKQTGKKAPPPLRQLNIIRAAFLIAMVISGFLAWSAFQAGPVPGCGPDSGCDKVLSSRWSRVAGMPVSVPALLVYALLLAELMRKVPRWNWLFPLATLVIAAAFWFTAVQAAILKSFCQYCMLAHAAGFAGAVLLLRQANAAPNRRRLSIAFSVIAVLLMASVQALAPAPGPETVRFANAPSAPTAAPTVPAAKPVFPILNGQFQLDLTEVPVSGPLDETNRLVKLFDYTCHHCRDLHHLLHRYSSSNEVTIVSLPVPLESSCNPLIKNNHPDHFDACEYARIGLAVFLANSNQFGPFSDWVYAPARPPSVAQTRAHAESLVGKEALAAALQNPKVNAQIQTNIAIYVASSRLARRGAMPQIIFQNSASVGSVPNYAQLEKILARGLGLPAAPPAQ